MFHYFFCTFLLEDKYSYIKKEIMIFNFYWDLSFSIKWIFYYKFRSSLNKSKIFLIWFHNLIEKLSASFFNSIFNPLNLQEKIWSKIYLKIFNCLLEAFFNCQIYDALFVFPLELQNWNVKDFFVRKFNFFVRKFNFNFNKNIPFNFSLYLYILFWHQFQF